VWDAPPRCPEPQAVQRILAQRIADRPDLAMEVAELDQANRWAIARVRRGNKSWSLRIWMQTPDGLRDRSLEGPDCASLAEAAATIVAMTLAGELDRQKAEAEAEAEPRDPARDEAELEAALAEILAYREGNEQLPPTEPETEEKPDRKPGGGLRLDGVLGLGVLPNFDAGGSLAGAVLWQYARLEFRGTFLAGGTEGVAGSQGATAKFNLASAAVRGCGVPPRPGRFEFPICLGVETGAVLGRIDGARFLHGPNLPWVGVSLGSMIIFAPIPQLAIVLGIEPWVSALTARHRAITGTVHETGRVGIRGSLGLEVRFGTED
jgi:hypothetical protein